MPSQKTLIWAGAAAATLVVAGAGAGALVWTHPGFVWPSPGSTLVEARAPERAAPSLPPAPAAGQAAAPSAANEGAAAPGVKPAPEVEVAAVNAAPPGVKPAFDVVTVEPTGEAVIAGRAAPNAKVELRDAGKTVAEATADASGQFVMISSDICARRPQSFPGGGRRPGGAGDIQCGRRLRSAAESCGRRAGQTRRTHALAARPCDADIGDISADRRIPCRHPVGRGRRRRRARRQRLGRAEFGRAPLSQRRRYGRRQDEVGRPLVAHDQTRHGAGRLCGARRRGQSGRHDGRCIRRDSVRLPGRAGVRERARRGAPGGAWRANRRLADGSAIVRTVAGRCGHRFGPDRASRVRPHAMGAQSKLLWRPDALPADLRGQQGADPQSEPDLSQARPSWSRSRRRSLRRGRARLSRPPECRLSAGQVRRPPAVVDGLLVEAASTKVS